MNFLYLSHPTKNFGQNINLEISGSKSESNRLLILKSFLKDKLEIINLSNSQDTKLMQQALQSTENIIDIHHAGTAMRFLTTYFSILEDREVTITGSSRMKERPIGILVDALKQLGAEISYTENHGYPPLKIKGKKITKNIVTLSASVSSQYISSLLLAGAFIENGLILRLDGKITSLPYLKMTIQLLNRLGIYTDWSENQSIKVHPYTKKQKSIYSVESDWSSASYLYSIVALIREGSLLLDTYYLDSLQGDKALVEIYENYFNVKTEFIDSKSKSKIKLSKITNKKKNSTNIELDLNHCPDIAQTILITSSALKIPCKLTGLHTLKIKETDRISAMQKELAKCNIITVITDDSIEITHIGDLPEKATIETYNDHRMAMAFAPLVLKNINLIIENPEVVEKSYPNFWKDLEKLGFMMGK